MFRNNGDNLVTNLAIERNFTLPMFFKTSVIFGPFGVFGVPLGGVMHPFLALVWNQINEIVYKRFVALRDK